MLIIPAIDILGGKCVRLNQGDYSRKTEYFSDPVAVAKQWVDQGAEYLHLVDLDGAKTGSPVNLDIITQIASSIPIPVEMGGGIRDIQTINKILSRGIQRVILGTIACENPDLVKEACHLHPEKIIVGIDGRNGKVAVKGWVETTEIKVIDLARQMTRQGVNTFVYTDIARDGTLIGPNFDSILNFAKAVEANVIASGGVSQLDDIEKLTKLGCPNITGVIIGKSLYDGSFTLKDALQLSHN